MSWRALPIGVSMDFKKLRIFQAVFTTRSITRAAELVNISQPAVSMHVSQLEQIIGFKLFERRKGRLYPTSEANSLYRHAESLFACLSNLESWVSQVNTDAQGELRIASLYGPAFKVIPRVLARFQKEFPQVSVSLTTGMSPQLLDLVMAGEFDFGIGESHYQDSSIWSQSISQRCYCAVSPRHFPLAKFSTIGPRELDGVPLISLPKWHRTNTEIEHAFNQAGVKRRALYHVDVWGVAMAMAGEGIGATIVDAINLSAFEHLDLCYRQFEADVSFDIAVMFPQARPRSRLAIRFVEIFMETVGDQQRSFGHS